jgi:hypothetical protein
MGPGLHLRLSLATIAVFLAMGLWLESMFGLRTRGFVDDDLRRELLRLGHAHGGLLGLLNLALAWAMTRLETPASWAPKIRVAALFGAWLVGLGFTFGGVWHGPTDPGAAVLVVPAGALMLFASCLACALLPGGDRERS